MNHLYPRDKKSRMGLFNHKEFYNRRKVNFLGLAQTSIKMAILLHFGVGHNFAMKAIPYLLKN